MKEDGASGDVDCLLRIALLHAFPYINYFLIHNGGLKVEPIGRHSDDDIVVSSFSAPGSGSVESKARRLEDGADKKNKVETNVPLL